MENYTRRQMADLMSTKGFLHTPCIYNQALPLIPLPLTPSPPHTHLTPQPRPLLVFAPALIVCA